MTSWYINKNYPTEIQNAFSDIEKVLSIKEGEIVSASSISQVIKYTVKNKNFYIKHYFSRGKKLRKYFGRPRWRAEWENLVFCKQLNICVPNIIAYGVKKRWFNTKASAGVIITEEVANALDLKTIATEHGHLLKQPTWRRQLITIIASYIKSMHQVNFIHYDLQWRNILVTTHSNTPQVYLFDIPSGRKRRFSFKHGVIRDFYNLYKNAWKFLSRTDCLRFYLLYKGKTALNNEDKAHIKEILDYFARKELKDLLYPD